MEWKDIKREGLSYIQGAAILNITMKPEVRKAFIENGDKALLRKLIYEAFTHAFNSGILELRNLIIDFPDESWHLSEDTEVLFDYEIVMDEEGKFKIITGGGEIECQ